jgi:thiamine biosynthesis protein ThiS
LSRFVTIQLNGSPREIQAETALGSLLESLGLKEVRIAVEHNEQVVPAEKHAEILLAEGDRIEIVTFVGGG